MSATKGGGADLQKVPKFLQMDIFGMRNFRKKTRELKSHKKKIHILTNSAEI